MRQFLPESWTNHQHGIQHNCLNKVSIDYVLPCMICSNNSSNQIKLIIKIMGNVNVPPHNVSNVSCLCYASESWHSTIIFCVSLYIGRRYSINSLFYQSSDRRHTCFLIFLVICCMADVRSIHYHLWLMYEAYTIIYGWYTKRTLSCMADVLSVHYHLCIGTIVLLNFNKSRNY